MKTNEELALRFGWILNTEQFAGAGWYTPAGKLHGYDCPDFTGDLKVMKAELRRHKVHYMLDGEPRTAAALAAALDSYLEGLT